MISNAGNYQKNRKNLQLNSLVVPLQRIWSQQTIERAPKNVILHYGTNDLKAATDPGQIVENTINLAKSKKTDKNNVIISMLISQQTIVILIDFK